MIYCERNVNSEQIWSEKKWPVTFFVMKQGDHQTDKELGVEFHPCVFMVNTSRLAKFVQMFAEILGLQHAHPKSMGPMTDQ